VLTKHRDHLEAIAKALLEYETLDGQQIKEILEHGRLINPPPGAPPPTQKMPPEKPPKQVVVAPDVTPPLPGALGGAPA
jgi:cell division protease FtsH